MQAELKFLPVLREQEFPYLNLRMECFFARLAVQYTILRLITTISAIGLVD